MKLSGLMKRIIGIEGLPIAAVLGLLYLIFYFAAPGVFSDYLIYMSFFQTVPPVLIMALGLTFVITAGEIDLSFPAVIALSGYVFTFWYKSVGEPFSGFALALMAGALVGWVNGLLVAKVRVPSIMATLAAQFFWAGVTLLLCGGLQVNILEIVDTPIHQVFVGRLFGIVPMQALWATGLAVFLWFLLNRHVFGEAIMFIGDNPDVARVMGIKVDSVRIRLFVMMGLIAAFAGLVLTLEANVFWPTQGQNSLLGVMASVFIGGTSIAGGEGVIVGTFFGSYIIGSLEAGVVASGIGGYWTQLSEGIVMGAVIVFNAAVKERSLEGLKNRLRSMIGQGPARAPRERNSGFPTSGS
jgi:simple sugar transport system permease protein